MRIALEANGARYIEGFTAIYLAIQIGRRTWYVQRTRTSSYDYSPINRLRRRIVLYRGPIWGVDVGTFAV